MHVKLVPTGLDFGVDVESSQGFSCSKRTFAQETLEEINDSSLQFAVAEDG